MSSRKCSKISLFKSSFPMNLINFNCKGLFGSTMSFCDKNGFRDQLIEDINLPQDADQTSLENDTQIQSPLKKLKHILEDLQYHYLVQKLIQRYPTEKIRFRLKIVYNSSNGFNPILSPMKMSFHSYRTRFNKHEHLVSQTCLCTFEC